MLIIKLKKFGFKRFRKDNFIFINNKGTIVVIYINDLLIFSYIKKAINKLKAQFDKEFKLKYLKAISFYLRIEILRNRDTRIIIII